MALTEQRRQQLDNIVQQMVQNKESDFNIKFVVDDFKKKYEQESIQQPLAQKEKILPKTSGILSTIGKLPKAIGETSEEMIVKPLSGLTSGIGKLGAIGAGAVQAGLDFAFDPKARKVYISGSPEDVKKINPALSTLIDKKTSTVLKDIGGTSAQAFSEGAMLAAAPQTALGRLGAGAAIGATSGISQPLQKDESLNKTLDKGIIGGLIGLAVSGVFEGVTRGVQKLAKTKLAQGASKNIYNQELQPNKKDLINSLKNNYKTIGEDIRNTVDDAGKPIYVGSYQTIKDKALKEISTNSNKVKGLLSQYDDITTTKSEILGNVVKRLKDEYITLSPSQIKMINEAARKLPANFNQSQALSLKQTIDNFVGDNNFTKLMGGQIDPKIAFAKNVYYLMRDELRKSINTKTGNAAIQALNNRISLAFEVRDLVAAQQAVRSLSKISAAGGGGGSLWRNTIGTLIDDILLPTALTTRVSQAIKKAAETTAKPTGQFIRTNIIRGLTK